MTAGLSIRSLLLVVFLCGACSRYSFRVPDPAGDSDFLGKKIALVGFLPPRTVPTEDRNQVELRLIETNRLKDLFQENRSISQLPSRGYRYADEKRIKAFISSYLEATGEDGILELENMLVAQGGGRFKLKDHPVDYYLVGIHLPFVESEVKTRMSAITQASSCVTLGFIPAYTRFRSYSHFLIYDNRLNLLRDFRYENEYSRMRTWYLWPFPGPQKEIADRGVSPPYQAFEADVLDFRRDFAQFLKRRRG
jgi:hypothetical protein